MKILFIENRYKTYFFDLVATELEKQGHLIYWIVQNPEFMPKSGTKFVIKYPSKSTRVNTEVNLDEIIESDRQINYFKKGDTSYFYYYYYEIRNFIEEISPDFVFGESTAFHELLSIKICKEKGFLFLQPSSCRYPSSRFSFYKYDTVHPYIGSKDLLLYADAESIINNIVDRSSKPDYMKKASNTKLKVIRDKVKILKSYLMGEKYNTPHPIIKYNIEKQKQKTITLWDSLSITQIDKTSFSILYPMHLQPEANIDVWGRARRDQLKSIKEISEQLKGEQILYVKPNPKSKYELSEKLIDFIESTNNVKMLHHKVSMDTVFNEIDLFITVNGTVALECIFSNKPILTLVNVFFNKAYNCLFLEEFSSLQLIIKKVMKSDFPRMTSNDKHNFLNLLNTTSYKGVISDPFCDENCVSKENIKQVVKAFESVLKK